MRVLSPKSNSAGFAGVEAMLVIVIIAAVVGVGAYVMHQKNSAATTLGNMGGAMLQSSTAVSGTAASI